MRRTLEADGQAERGCNARLTVSVPHAHACSRPTGGRAICASASRVTSGTVRGMFNPGDGTSRRPLPTVVHMPPTHQPWSAAPRRSHSPETRARLRTRGSAPPPAACRSNSGSSSPPGRGPVRRRRSAAPAAPRAGPGNSGGGSATAAGSSRPPIAASFPNCSGTMIPPVLAPYGGLIGGNQILPTIRTTSLEVG